MSFRDIVKALEDYTELSESGGMTHRTWATMYESMDMHTGEFTNFSLHFSRNNPTRKQKYWVKALKTAFSK